MILECKNLYKDYYVGKTPVPVLKDINFSLEKGEYVAIMGPSGSGKTTLMNQFGCLDRPTSGDLLIDGENVVGMTENQLAELRNRTIGFVFQSAELLPELTAIDNVALPLLYRGMKKADRRERAIEMLQKVGLENRMLHKPNQLSGGQRQRVAIARAIAGDPDILLADEPTGALDSQSGKQIMQIFRQLNDEGMAILMITHDQKIANEADRICYIYDGVLSDHKEDAE